MFSPGRGSVYLALPGAVGAGNFLYHQNPTNPGGAPLLPRSSSRMGEGRGHPQAQRGEGSSLLLPVTCCVSLSVTHCPKIKKKRWSKSSQLQMKQLFQSLSHSFILMGDGEPPSAPHCLLIQLQALQQHPASQPCISASPGREEKQHKPHTHKKKKPIPVWVVWSHSSVCK